MGASLLAVAKSIYYIVFLWHESEAQGLSAHCNEEVGKHF